MSNVQNQDTQVQNVQNSAVKNGMKKHAMDPNNVKLREWCDMYVGRTKLMSSYIYGGCIGMYKSGRRKVTKDQMKIIDEAISTIEYDELSGLIKRIPRSGDNFSNLAENGDDLSPEDYARIRDSEQFIMFKHFLMTNSNRNNVLINHFGLTFLSAGRNPVPQHYTDNNIERFERAKAWVDAGAIESDLHMYRPKTGNRGSRKLKNHTTVTRRAVSASMADRDVNNLMAQLNTPALSNLVPVIYAVNYDKTEDTTSFDRFLSNTKSKVYLIVTLKSCIKHAWDVINHDKPIAMVVH